MNNFKLVGLDDYVPFIGDKVADRIRQKAEFTQGLRVVHVNSTLYGGGVAVLLDSLTLLMKSVGIRVEWDVIQGAPDFFGITKRMHNALQGAEIDFSREEIMIYEQINYKNSLRNRLDEADFVVIHDPQPLPMVQYVTRKSPWIWRCHIDLSQRQPKIWKYLRTYIKQYDAIIFSIPEYRQKLRKPQLFFLPAIDPFSITNQEMTVEETDRKLAEYGIPTDLPLVVQISRFDRWKDPEGVIRVFRKVRKKVDATLVLVGNIATDDPEGEEVYRAMLSAREERIMIFSVEDTALVNALQRRASVILQKSIREGFGLTVAEAMWKGTPVIGGNVGGIRYQIQNGENGYLVSSDQEAAQRLTQLLENPNLRMKLGEQARETVRAKFLMTRLLEQYLDLFASFETVFKYKRRRARRPLVGPR